MKKCKKRRSFFSLLVGNYIVFTLAIAFCGGIIFTVTTLAMTNFFKLPNAEKLFNYNETMQLEQYDKIPVKKVLGKMGFVQVLDEQYQVIYESKAFNKKIYTEGEIECIPDYNSNRYVNVLTYETKEHEKRTLLTIDTYTAQSGYTENGFMVLDENLQVILSTLETSRKSFTPIELAYLSEKAFSDYIIKKYVFRTEKGTVRTLLMFIPEVNDMDIDRYFRIGRYGYYAFGSCYVVMIIIFILWLNRKVKKPLTILNQAMLNFADGKRDGQVDYRGPAEFMQICESFNKMSTRLAESERVRSQLEEDKQKMLADISHDLKTPITVIQGYSKAICDGLIGEEKKMQYLMTIYKKSTVLTELINAFYEYSKLEHPDFHLVLETLDVCEYVREYLVSKYDEIEIAGIHLEVEVPEEVILCTFDPLQLKRVLENIIANALKHNPKGTFLYFVLTKEAAAIRLTLADNGIGIPAHIANNIFEPFIVGDDSRNNKQGSGLGMAISKKIIIAHHGTIELVIPPEAPYHTQFEIHLPIFS